MPKVDIGELRSRAGSAFEGFTRGQKTMLALAVAGVLVGGFLFTQWSAQTSYSALYSNLSAKDASDVTQRLNSSNVKYKLADNGSTIMVPQKDVYQLRLDLSSAGLPSTGQPGYALLDKQGITTSEFRQRVDYQRALEGELANTISAIKGVTGANVHIVIPQQDLFTKDSTKPTASVLVQESDGTKLSAGQVQAIVHLVASSVEGLDPVDVTVADGNGHVLSAPGNDVAAAGDARSEQTSAFEKELSDSITDLIVPVVGPGHAVVKVKAALDFDTKSTKSETFGNVNGSIPVSESTTKEAYAGLNGNGATGILGQTTQTTVAGGGNYDKESADRAFAVDKVTQDVQTAPGKVSKLSVAVLLDGGAKNVDINTIQNLVTAAAGIDATRGDTVRVEALKFDTTAADAAKKALTGQQAAKPSPLLDLARTLGALLLVLVVLFLAWRSARKATVHRVPFELPAPIELGPGSYTESTPALVGAGVGAHGVAAPDPVALPDPPRQIEPPKQLISDQLVELIDQQPDDVAQMLRGWLADRRG